MKILIIGDSFSADEHGWPSLLGHEVINKSEKGIGEYKIFAKSRKLPPYDKIIINHTSPWRVHARTHPIHKDDPTRKNNDFLLNDVEYHSKINKDMMIVNEYLKKYFDPKYQQDVYNLFVADTMKIKNSIHITFHDPEDTSQIKHNYNYIYKKYPGDVNHMSKQGNELVAELVENLL